MKQAFMKKLIVGSIACSVMFAASTVYAEGRTVSAQTEAAPAAKAAGDERKDETAHHRHGKKWPIVEEAASLIGVNKETMIKLLQSGKSIAEVAAAKGISEADLTAKLQTLRSGKIDAAVKDGKMTADQGEHMKQKLPEHLKSILNEKHLFDKMNDHGKWHMHGMMKPDSEKLALSLGMSREELKSELKAGKSLAEIAAAKGISKDKLVQTIKDQLTPSIEKMINCKKNDGPKQ